MDSTREKTNTKIVNNEELQVNVTCHRDKVKVVRHHLNNIEKGQKELRG
jgi:hypothetical protein